MGGSSGSSGGGKTEIRYADYVEDHHHEFLNEIEELRDAEIALYNDGNSPFSAYTDIPVDVAFFGTGYLISNFPSLYDMFGKLMAGLDIDALYTQIFADTVNSAEVANLISAEAALLDDDIETNSLPRLQAGLRDVNAVVSSSFVVAKGIIEDARVKSIERFSADLKYRLIPIAQARWNTHMEWNKGVVGVYSELIKFYFSAKTDVDEVNYSMAVKHRLWPFTVMDFERAALGALQGAINQKAEVAGASRAAKALSGALTGAAMGGMVGSSISAGTGGTTMSMGQSTYGATGAVVGAVLGAAAALTY